jgi:hypothetical protein
MVAETPGGAIGQLTVMSSEITDKVIPPGNAVNNNAAPGGEFPSPLLVLFALFVPLLILE